MKTSSPTLFLMCGLPCSGKTTRAKELETTHRALRLTPDEWMAKIVGNGFDETRRAAVEAIMIQIAERCLSLGINVILDFGFWSRSEREAIKALAQKAGAKVVLHFMDASTQELLERMEGRNNTTPDNTFDFTEEQLQLWSTWFEKPDSDELE